MYGAREYRGSHVWLVVCLFALTGAACAGQDETFSHVNDVGPDAAAGSALATAELAAASDPFVDIVSPVNNQTYTYSAPGIAVTVNSEIGNGVAGPGGGQYKLAYFLNGTEAQQVPAAGAFTFQGVLWGRHHLSVQLINAGTGEALTNPESRDAIYVRVTSPCVPSQGDDVCEDGLQCSGHNDPDPRTNSEPAQGSVKPFSKACAEHTSPIPPWLGATSRQIVAKVNEEQAPPNQTAGQLTGGGRSLMTPG